MRNLNVEALARTGDDSGEARYHRALSAHTYSVMAGFYKPAPKPLK